VLEELRMQREAVAEALRGVPEAEGGKRYADDKWTVREVIGHLSDAERIYQFRALAIARGEAGPLPPYDPDGYVAAAAFDTRTISSLVEEFATVRLATLALFTNFPADAWDRAAKFGEASVSVRGWAFVAVGHVAEHMRVLRERYGLAV
jgi:hypothetical protein